MKTIKQIADEIGVSKQAVYKRLTGKLASVCAPYVYTEHSKTFLTDEGVNIIKSDFENNPSATKMHTDRSVCASGAHTEQDETTSGTHTERSGVVEENEQLKAQLLELKHQLALLEQNNLSALKEIELLKQTIAELKTDKTDLQKHRDNLTTALTVSKSDLARLENIITQMAALPLRTRVFGWSGAVAQLTTSTEEISQVVVDSMIDEDANG